jgi:hypothetical protein
MSLARLNDPINWGLKPRWQWVAADALIIFAAFALPVLAAALFDPGVLTLAFGLGGSLAVIVTAQMETSDPNDWDKISDLASRLLIPGALTLGYLLAWWAGLLWAALCGAAFLFTVEYSRP